MAINDDFMDGWDDGETRKGLNLGPTRDIPTAEQNLKQLTLFSRDGEHYIRTYTAAAFPDLLKLFIVAGLKSEDIACTCTFNLQSTDKNKTGVDFRKAHNLSELFTIYEKAQVTHASGLMLSGNTIKISLTIEQYGIMERHYRAALEQAYRDAREDNPPAR